MRETQWAQAIRSGADLGWWLKWRAFGGILAGIALIVFELLFAAAMLGADAFGTVLHMSGSVSFILVRLHGAEVQTTPTQHFAERAQAVEPLPACTCVGPVRRRGFWRYLQGLFVDRQLHSRDRQHANKARCTRQGQSEGRGLAIAYEAEDCQA